MAKLRFDLAISLDGLIAGPNPSEQQPLGEGGMQLHEWAFELAAWREPHGQQGGEVNASTAVVQEMTCRSPAARTSLSSFSPRAWSTSSA
jgi:hypothetical protein